MPKKILVILVLIAGAVFVAAFGLGKLGKEGGPAGDQNGGTDEKVIKGVTLTPKSFSGAEFTEFFPKAKEAGEVVTWSGDWEELAKTSGGGPYVVSELSKTYGYTPVVIAQFFTQSTGKLLRPLTNDQKQSYRQSAVNFSQKYKPKYLGLGIEVNMLYEKGPSDFESFVSFFAEVYAAVKEVSPDTEVFTVFQLEKMKGLGGGLFGGTNDASQNEWALLEKFSAADFFAFTTYPGLIYKSPSEIPADYYLEIGSKTQKPIAFTEIGWHTEASPAGWEGSEAEQAEFISLFFELSGDLKRNLLVWSFLYDQETIEPFRSMGLLKKDGTAKSAWETWKSAAP